MSSLSGFEKYNWGMSDAAGSMAELNNNSWLNYEIWNYLTSRVSWEDRAKQGFSVWGCSAGGKINEILCLASQVLEETDETTCHK